MTRRETIPLVSRVPGEVASGILARGRLALLGSLLISLGLGSVLISLGFPATTVAASAWPQAMPLYANPIAQRPESQTQPHPEYPAPPSQEMVSRYASQWHLPAAEASSHLEVENRGLKIAAWEANALGKGFGGVWFDNETGKFHVGIAEGSAVATGRQVTDEMEMTEDTTFQSVRWSQEELEAAVATVSEAIRPISLSHEAKVGIDTAADSVDVGLSTAASQSNREFVEQVVRAASVTTVIVDEEPSSFMARPKSCEIWYDHLIEGDVTFCNKPLRSASAMDRNLEGGDEAVLCSIGGVAFNGSQTYVVTAGHCLKGGLGRWWSAVDISTGERHNIGIAERAVAGTNGDFGLINETGNYWEAPYTWYANIPYQSATYEMGEAIASYEGLYQCWAGSQSTVHGHLGCGTVIRTDITWDGEEHLDESRGRPEEDPGHELCIEGGDSGGPVITDNELDGIIVSGYSCGEGGYTADYSPAPRIESEDEVEFLDDIS